MISFENSHQAFPPGQLAPNQLAVDFQRSPMLGHLGFIFPFIEESNFRARFDAIDWSINSQDAPWFFSQEFLKASNHRVSVLRCPADPGDGPLRKLRVIVTVGRKTALTMDASVDYQGWTNYLGSMGTISAVDRGRAIATGIFFGRTMIPLQEISDGLSHTLLMGEVIGGTSGLSLDQRTDLRNSFFQNGIPIDDWFSAGSKKDFSGLVFESHHQSGSNWAFCDGNVQVLAESIDSAVLQSLATRNGGELR